MKKCDPGLQRARVGIWETAERCTRKQLQGFLQGLLEEEATELLGSVK